VAKGESRRDGAREPYGARAISYEVHDSWEVRGQADPEKKTLVTSMFHRKHRGPAYPPFTFTIEYPQDGVTLVHAGGILEDSATGGQVRQITAYLATHGMATNEEISKGTAIEANSVRSVLSRYKGRKFAKVGDQWAVQGAQHPTENEG
jgi:predicted PhzF superfamily epimerase YddE/YHI9